MRIDCATTNDPRRGKAHLSQHHRLPWRLPLTSGPAHQRPESARSRPPLGLTPRGLGHRGGHATPRPGSECRAAAAVSPAPVQMAAVAAHGSTHNSAAPPAAMLRTQCLSLAAKPSGLSFRHCARLRARAGVPSQCSEPGDRRVTTSEQQWQRRQVFARTGASTGRPPRKRLGPLSGLEIQAP